MKLGSWALQPLNIEVAYGSIAWKCLLNLLSKINILETVTLFGYLFLYMDCANQLAVIMSNHFFEVAVRGGNRSFCGEKLTRNDSHKRSIMTLYELYDPPPGLRFRFPVITLIGSDDSDRGRRVRLQIWRGSHRDKVTLRQEMLSELSTWIFHQPLVLRTLVPIVKQRGSQLEISFLCMSWQLAEWLIL